ncbi:hypothetical protein GCM10011515_00480 [Tsuneonella deserti]|uniref:Bacterial OB-fold domain-containing protein n=1 Tax=Tsuneonella deserti TaxID=2035528 RepID=A0ABQ1RWT5_9SPHN|nr:NirD/YgiW/YdeI family stress tolerance protein [Tsuneonella deserti]GGD84638.1 hypothetical protein GCM10011515_00480 [Tsuneonella deserti]
MLGDTDRPISTTKIAATVFALSAALALSGCGDTSEVQNADASVATVAKPVNGDWITIDGVIASKFPDQFILDYGTGKIDVEMDDWDKTLEGVALLPGDKVSVTGRVDNDLFEKASIEASSVYVSNLNTTFFASGADEEDLGLHPVPETTLNSGVDYTGWVTGTWDKGFSLGAGPMLVRVDTSNVKNPLVRNGISAGDRVYVWGDLAFKKGESVLEADGLMRLIDGGTVKNSGASNAAATQAASAPGTDPEKSGTPSSSTADD